MKKIPTLFVREFDGNHGIKSIKPELTSESLRWVLDGEGDATTKLDGACCAVIDKLLYKRYDAKRGKKPPEGAIPCGDPDPITGHWPHWVAVNPDNPADKWFLIAYGHTAEKFGRMLEDRTYEAIGPHFNGNPYGMDHDELAPHGVQILNGMFDRTFDGIRDFLKVTPIEGIVFWKDGNPQCKIKRTDFGFEWPVKPHDAYR